jgi:poly(A)-specific ribonuclease
MDRQMKAFSEYLEGEPTGPFIFERCNGFLMKYIYQQVEQMKNIWIKKNDEGNLEVKKVSDEEIETLKQEKLAQNQEAYRKAMGFRLIFKKLIESKKPMIGHNCFFDILFILRWFDGPLDSNFSSLRQRLRVMFPSVFDTK